MVLSVCRQTKWDTKDKISGDSLTHIKAKIDGDYTRTAGIVGTQRPVSLPSRDNPQIESAYPELTLS